MREYELMKTSAFRVFRLASIVLLPLGAFAAPRPEQPWQTANKAKDEMWKQGKTCAQIIEALEKMRGETHYATNAYTRAYIDRMIVYQCRRPGWTGLKRWNINLESRIPGVIRRDLDDPEVGWTQKIELAALLSEYLAGEKDFKGGEEVIRKVMAIPGQRANFDVAKGHFALVSLYRWQERFADAWKELEKAVELDPGAAVRQAFVLAEADGDFARAEKMAEKIVDIPSRLYAYDQSKHRTETARKLALAYVKDAKNPLNRRCGIALGWFGYEKTPEHIAAFEAVRKEPKEKVNLSYEINNPINHAYWKADYPAVTEIFETFAGINYLKDARLQRVYANSLVVCGRKDDALKVVATNLANTALKPLDRTKFEITKALLSGADAAKVVAAAKLERKDEIAAVLTAARQALMFGMGDAAETLAAKYSAYFVDFPQRNLKVYHSKTPIESVADWRKVYDKLDRQVCDRKFGANLDALETDVATGRKSVEKTTLDSSEAQVEVSSVSDSMGVHVFLRVEDPNARQVENGFAGGIGTEMYFAPGKYEPYICFGSDPRAGVEHAFQTTYSYADHKRIDVEGRKDKRAFRSETAFTDTDYVLHLFFAWDTFYQKLPQNGSKWRFECIAFGPKGPFSLGGSENVHNSSKWCDLEFGFGKDDLTAIRRGIIYRHVKGWASVGRLDRFDKWADAEIGDPEFYDAVLKPIEAELKGYAKMVKPEMSDADVNLVYEKGLIRWLGLPHEIDELRRIWLQDGMCK